jgi:hypothetical protein
LALRYLTTANDAIQPFLPDFEDHIDTIVSEEQVAAANAAAAQNPVGG